MHFAYYSSRVAIESFREYIKPAASSTSSSLSLPFLLFNRTWLASWYLSMIALEKVKHETLFIANEPTDVKDDIAFMQISNEHSPMMR